MGCARIVKKRFWRECPPKPDQHFFHFMRAIVFVVSITLSAALLPARAAVAGAMDRPPDFDAVRALVLTNLPGVTATEVNRYAIEGLLRGLRGKLRLVEPSARPEAARPNISKCARFGGEIAYLRVSGVVTNLDQDVLQCCRALAATNALHGVVLDLRFADGEDYAAATAVADLFVPGERDLLDWGHGLVRSTAKTNALTWPVVALVNGETAGASEALAALLRDTGAGLILGSRTLGAAMIAKEFPLADGQRLRLASLPVKLASGSPLPSDGLTPDIQVDVAPAEERAYWNDPYGLKPSSAVTNSSGAATNRMTRRVRTTEADLVRARREGLDLEGELAPPREPEPEVRVIRDPVLGRAVDLLKGLAVVRPTP